MAATVGKANATSHSFALGDRIGVIADVTLDNSYATGGYTITPAQLGLSEIHFLQASPQAGAVGTVSSAHWDYSAGKLKAAQAGSEIASTTDLHTVVLRVFAIGRGFATLRG